MADAKKVRVSILVFIDEELDPAHYPEASDAGEMLDEAIEGYMDPAQLMEYVANGGAYQVIGRVL